MVYTWKVIALKVRISETCFIDHILTFPSLTPLFRFPFPAGHHAVGQVLSPGVTAGKFPTIKPHPSVTLFNIVVVSCIVLRRQFCCTRTATEEQSIRAFMDPIASGTPSVEIFLNYYSSQVPTRYSYAQIMIYTNNLAEKLGKGGFGTVYKGQLPTGREIAVKILDESKQSEQQFIAEVATVGTTCHVNLVRLLGYSSQGSIKALVYEYMVNGSLDKYIHGGHHDELSWKQLYSIALGTARGIAYLHDECRNRILHFDIKPHNVLLDDTFCPKVAYFGLAQITNREESHISVGYRGTLGYSAPEMVSRMYGVVTDRSDVYSYGMLVMEMVGARQNIDFHNKESTSSKFFYPEWAFKQVEKGQFGNLRKGNMSEEEQRIAKSLSLVGLWCIQFNAVRRPPMSKVIEMLEEDAGITTPPYPFPVDPPMIEMHLDDSDPSSSTITTPTPFPFPIDPPMTTMQHHAPSCSATYPLEVEKKNPKSTHNAQT